MSGYDGFADQYDQTFQLAPWRTHIEAYSLLTLAGDVRGQAWLDVACGTGAYARWLRRRGARPVFGVDVSADMLRVARTAEEHRTADEHQTAEEHQTADEHQTAEEHRTAEGQEWLGIEYRQHDVGSMPKLGEFDGALGSHLLHYATDADHLRGMCRSVADNLVSGGRFLTFQLNPDLSRRPDYYLPYGAELNLDPDRTLADGDGFTFRINVPGFRSPEVTIHYWSRPALNDALRAAGFDRIRWSMPELSPAAASGPDPEQWHDYLAEPLCVIIECEKI